MTVSDSAPTAAELDPPPRLGWLGRLAESLIRGRWWLLAAAVLATVLAWGPSRRLAFEQSIESLYADDHPRLLAYRQSKQIFGGDEFVIVAYRDPSLFISDDQLNDDSTERLRDLADRLRDVPGVIPASVRHIGDVLRAPYGRAKLRNMMTGLLLGTDRETTAVMLRVQPVHDAPVPRSQTFREIRRIAAAHDPGAAVVGEPIQVQEMFRYVEEDGAILGATSTILLTTLLFVFFRSWRWMLLPIFVVQVTLIWTKALLVVSGVELSMVSSMLDSLVTIIGIATVMHLIIRFREHRAHVDRATALSRAVRELAPPTLWTILTTAAGFAALMSSQIAPVASFGSMMTLATLLILVAVAMLAPGWTLWGTIAADPLGSRLEDRVGTILAGIVRRVMRAPRTVSAIVVFVMGFFAAGLLRLSIETDFSKNFREHSPIVQALNFFETNLGGAGNWEINFPAPRELDEDYMEKVETLVARLRELEQRTTPNRLTKIVALTEPLELVPRSLLFRVVPLETRLSLLKSFQSEFYQTVYNEDRGRMRILLRSLERQPSESKVQLIEEVEAIAREQFPEAEATGMFVLLTYLIQSLMADQWTSFGLAAVALVLLMTAAFGSLRLGISLLLPNVFPIVLVLGGMGWLGLTINLATAMIASVSLGLTVDSSIHYLASYRAARQGGLSMARALEHASSSAGLALLLSNLALVGGFSVLTLSHFVPLVYFGVLVSVAMLGGLLGNLVMLPLIVLWLERPGLVLGRESADSVTVSPRSAASDPAAEGALTNDEAPAGRPALLDTTVTPSTAGQSA